MLLSARRFCKQASERLADRQTDGQTDGQSARLEGHLDFIAAREAVDTNLIAAVAAGGLRALGPLDQVSLSLSRSLTSFANLPQRVWSALGARSFADKLDARWR